MERPFSDGDPRWAPLDGANLIEASAGTGKTYTITALFLRLVLEKGLGADQILVVTYTKAATEELRDRIRRRLVAALGAFETGTPGRDETLEGLLQRVGDRDRAARTLRIALMQFDEAPIYTIHGFCQRVLRDNAFESKSLFDTELVTDQDELIAAVADDFWRGRAHRLSPLLLAYLLHSGITADSLGAIAGAQGAMTDIPLVPKIRPMDPVALEQEFSGCVAALKDLWGRERKAIEDILQNSPALKRNQYRVESVKKWCGKLDGWLKAETPVPAEPFKEFGKFTPGGLAAGTKKGKDPPSHAFFDCCARARELFREFERWSVEFKVDFLASARREQALRKQRENIQSFDDLLHRLAGALRSESGDGLAAAILARYPAALVDEFQDTDPIQYEIFRRIYRRSRGSGTGSSALFLIGDPKQAIYGFRGADIHAYIRACSEVDASYTLKTNWRSEPDLVAAVNAVFAGEPPPFVFDHIGYREIEAAPDGLKEHSYLTEDGQKTPPLRLWWFPRSGEEGVDKSPMPKFKVRDAIYGAVAGEVSRLIREGARGRLTIGSEKESRNLQPADIAVLVRKHGQARRLQQELTALNIPSVLYSQESLFASEEAGELERILTALANPGDGDAVKRAMLTRIMGMNGSELHEILTEEGSRWEEWLDRFRAYRDLWLSRGFVFMFRRFLDGEGVSIRLLGGSGGERRLTNLMHAGELLQQAAAEHSLGMDGLLKWLREQREGGDGGDDERQLRLESDEERVKIVTIHRSKGLEYSVVLCPFLWDGHLFPPPPAVPFHDEKHDGRLTLDLGSEEREIHEGLAKEEQLKENLRLLYVALTRARHRCYVVWGSISSCGASPLGYVLHRHRVDGTRAFDQKGIKDLVEGLTDQEMRSDLAALEKRAGGGFVVEDIPRSAPVALKAGGDGRRLLAAREFAVRIRDDWRVTSYTGLVSASAQVPGEATIEDSGWNPEPQDHDQQDREHDEGGEGRQGASVIEDFGEVGLVGRRIPGQAVDPIFHLPRGAATGIMLHGILEKLDFPLAASAAGAAALEEAVAKKLRDFGFDEGWRDTVVRMMGKVVTTPLVGADSGFCLGAIPREKRLDELEFFYPLAAMTPEGLQSVFSEFAVRGQDRPVSKRGVHGPAHWADLRFPPLRGFMKGYVDLVFEHGGKFYLVDYKSNHLGSSPEDYRPDRLAEVMAREQYVLQYHVYAVALHRYLLLRVPGYRYASHFGGVFYLFLRGMDPRHPPGNGVFFDRPAEDLIGGLSQYFSGNSSSAGGPAS